MAIVELIDRPRSLQRLARPVVDTHDGERESMRGGWRAISRLALSRWVGRRGSWRVRSAVMQGNTLVPSQEVPAREGGPAVAQVRLFFRVCERQMGSCWEAGEESGAKSGAESGGNERVRT